MRKKEPDWSERTIEWNQRRIVWALEKIPSEIAVGPLREALKQKDAELKLWAVFALEKIGTAEALKVLEDYKKQEHRESKFFSVGELREDYVQLSTALLSSTFREFLGR
ncbi:MAG: HEAT repeat domain-containing protein [Candidatus Aminicenantales bacterium]